MADMKAILRARLNPRLYSALSKLNRTLRRSPNSTKPGSLLRYYVATEPSPQAALDIFRGEWSSRFPPPFSELEAGQISLFEDARVHWALSQFGDVQGKSILELGPLEGGHSYMLERAGFGSVLAIEANTHAYLKCLITKEITGLSHTHFLCGDFVKYLRNSPPRFDAVFACGVLYHMENPAELVSLLSLVTDQLFIWTHHYAPGNPQQAAGFAAPQAAEHKGFSHALFRQDYGGALDFPGFCGGRHRGWSWMKREDILACLKYFGFVDIRTSFDELDHPNGPAFAIVAKKGTASKDGTGV
jgi:Protein of unknown function (DUF1698)